MVSDSSNPDHPVDSTADAGARDKSVLGKLRNLGPELPQPLRGLFAFFTFFGVNGAVGLVAGLVIALLLWWNGWLPERSVKQVYQHGPVVDSTQRAVNNLWNLRSARINVIYAAKGVLRASRENKKVVAEEGGLAQGVYLSDPVESAFALAKALPASALRNAVLRPGDLDAHECGAGDLIVLGGPIANFAYTRAYAQLKQISKTPRFDFDESVYRQIENPTLLSLPRIIHDNLDSTISFVSTYKVLDSLNKSVEVDYALFVAGPNPFSSKDFLIVVAGSHKIGTDGATKFLTSPSNAEELNRLLQNRPKERPYLTGIIKVDSQRGNSTLLTSAYF